MTGPRIPLFQRPGGSSPSPIPDTTAPAMTDAPAEGMAEQVPATCPQCGCTFDVASGEVMPEAGGDAMPMDAGAPTEGM